MADDVPVIDLTDLDDDPARVVADLDAACREVGFFQIRGHGIPPRVLTDVLGALEQFWARPEADKLAIALPSPDINRGYSAAGTESLAYSLGVDSPPDRFESFTMGVDDPVLAERDPDAGTRSLFAPNRWPDGIPAFEPAMRAWFAEAARTTRTVTALLARALGLGSGFFVDRATRGADVLRAILYQADDGATPPDSLRLGAHTDYGLLTVLWADPVAGLEIVGPDGTWISVVPEPGCVVVNLGDLLAAWTNDRWRSTIHRVSPGPVRRRSLAFFHNVDHDTLVECLPSCTTPDRPPWYPPVVAGQHYLAKLTAPRTRPVADDAAVSTVGGRSVD